MLNLGMGGLATLIVRPALAPDAFLFGLEKSAFQGFLAKFFSLKNVNNSIT